MTVDLLHSSDHSDDEVEDYIDIEVSTKPNLFLHSKTSPPQPREFEFQMFSISSERDTTTSPADELFYKGKLLPLHLPPRLQMVEKLLQNSTYPPKKDCFEEYFSTPLATTAYTTPIANNTPFESCNVSPNESCQVSRELNPDEYFFNYSTGEANINFISDNPKKSWTRKMKQSTLGSKLKASRAYLKSLFGKPDRSDEPSAELAERSSSPFKVSASCTKEDINTRTKMSKKAPFGQIQRYEKPKTKSFNKEKVVADNGAHHRRSFSGAVKRLSTAKSFSSASSSSTSSTSSNRIHDSHLLKRSSSSVCSDAENSIQSAIAHCKQSQQEFHSRRTISEIGLGSMSVLSASTVIMEDHETSGVCIS